MWGIKADSVTNSWNSSSDPMAECDMQTIRSTSQILLLGKKVKSQTYVIINSIVYVNDIVIDELKRIIKDSEIMK